jgi:hypothetical protein
LVNKKSGSALPTPDKHKSSLTERRPLPFWEDWLVTSRGEALELDSKNKEPLKALLHFKAVLWHSIIPKLIHDKRCADKHRNDIIAETVEHENQKPQF